MIDRDFDDVPDFEEIPELDFFQDACAAMARNTCTLLKAAGEPVTCDNVLRLIHSLPWTAGPVRKRSVAQFLFLRNCFTAAPPRVVRCVVICYWYFVIVNTRLPVSAHRMRLAAFSGILGGIDWEAALRQPPEGPHAARIDACRARTRRNRQGGGMEEMAYAKERLTGEVYPLIAKPLSRTLAEKREAGSMPPNLEVIVNDNIELTEAGRRGELGRLRALLAGGADASAKNEHGSTPLHAAASWNDRPVVELLLDHGANVHARDWEGDTPLHIAAAFGDKAVIGLLLDRGADINVRDDTGWTPLHLAAPSAGSRRLDSC